MRARQFLTVTSSFFFLSLLVPAIDAHAEENAKTEWAALLLQGKKLGHTKQMRTLDRDKVITRQELSMEIRRGSLAPMAIDSFIEIIETIDGAPLAFKYRQTSPGSSIMAEGAIQPDGKLHVRTGNAGLDEKERIIDWPEGAVMEEGGRLLARRMGLREGTTYRYKQFMPDSLQVMDVDVLVGGTTNVDLLGRVVPLTKVEQTLQAQGESIRVKSFVDRQFESQKTVMPMIGMEMEMVVCTEVYALSRNDPADFFNAALVVGPRNLSPADLSRAISYELTPTQVNAGLNVPTSDEQEVIMSPTTKGALVVRVRRVKAPSGARFPYNGTDEAALESLKPTTWIQSDATEIIDLARKAVGDTRDSATAVKRIQDFVRSYITKKDLSVGYASALEVVRGREGDCTEHALLVAALCRAVGIPARVVSGVVYAQQFCGKNNIFIPHAWAQAYISGRWISIDAALKGFDAGHIAFGFGNGDPFYFFRLVNTLGNFKIDNLTVS